MCIIMFVILYLGFPHYINAKISIVDVLLVADSRMHYQRRTSIPYIVELLQELFPADASPGEEARPFSTRLVLVLMALAAVVSLVYALTSGVLQHE
jgi:hypothetical protein